MKFTAGQVAELINGKVEGNKEAVITNVSKIEEGKPETLTFLANPKYTHYLYTTEAEVVIINDSFVAEQDVKATLIRVPDAYKALAQLLEMYEQSQPKKSGVEQPSFIDSSATLGDFAYVGAFAYIGENVKIGNNVQIYPQAFIGDNVAIGDNSIVYAGAKIYKHCRIGENCIIHAGAVIGSDGFGFAPDENNEYKKIAQIGNVILEDNVEVGANCALDRATMGSTIIRKGAKLDNLIQVAHNVEVGENTVLAAQAGIAGSAKIGKNCMFGGQVGIAGHISIADNTKIGAQAGVGGNIKKEGLVLMGSPVIDVKQFYKSSVIFRRLPELKTQLDQLQKEIDSLK